MESPTTLYIIPSRMLFPQTRVWDIEPDGGCLMYDYQCAFGLMVCPKWFLSVTTIYFAGMPPSNSNTVDILSSPWLTFIMHELGRITKGSSITLLFFDQKAVDPAVLQEYQFSFQKRDVPLTGSVQNVCQKPSEVLLDLSEFIDTSDISFIDTVLLTIRRIIWFGERSEYQIDDDDHLPPAYCTPELQRNFVLILYPNGLAKFTERLKALLDQEVCDLSKDITMSSLDLSSASKNDQTRVYTISYASLAQYIDGVAQRRYNDRYLEKMHVIDIGIVLSPHAPHYGDCKIEDVPFWLYGRSGEMSDVLHQLGYYAILPAPAYVETVIQSVLRPAKYVKVCSSRQKYPAHLYTGLFIDALSFGLLVAYSKKMKQNSPNSRTPFICDYLRRLELLNPPGSPPLTDSAVNLLDMLRIERYPHFSLELFLHFLIRYRLGKEVIPINELEMASLLTQTTLLQPQEAEEKELQRMANLVKEINISLSFDRISCVPFIMERLDEGFQVGYFLDHATDTIMSCLGYGEYGFAVNFSTEQNITPGQYDAVPSKIPSCMDILKSALHDASGFSTTNKPQLLEYRIALPTWNALFLYDQRYLPSSVMSFYALFSMGNPRLLAELALFAGYSIQYDRTSHISLFYRLYDNFTNGLDHSYTISTPSVTDITAFIALYSRASVIPYKRANPLLLFSGSKLSAADYTHNTVFSATEAFPEITENNIRTTLSEYMKRRIAEVQRFYASTMRSTTNELHCGIDINIPRAEPLNADAYRHWLQTAPINPPGSFHIHYIGSRSLVISLIPSISVASLRTLQIYLRKASKGQMQVINPNMLPCALILQVFRSLFTGLAAKLVFLHVLGQALDSTGEEFIQHLEGTSILFRSQSSEALRRQDPGIIRSTAPIRHSKYYPMISSSFHSLAGNNLGFAPAYPIYFEISSIESSPLYVQALQDFIHACRLMAVGVRLYCSSDVEKLLFSLQRAMWVIGLQTTSIAQLFTVGVETGILGQVHGKIDEANLYSLHETLEMKLRQLPKSFGWAIKKQANYISVYCRLPMSLPDEPPTRLEEHVRRVTSALSPIQLQDIFFPVRLYIRAECDVLQLYAPILKELQENLEKKAHNISSICEDRSRQTECYGSDRDVRGYVIFEICVRDLGDVTSAWDAIHDTLKHLHYTLHPRLTIPRSTPLYSFWPFGVSRSFKMALQRLQADNPTVLLDPAYRLYSSSDKEAHAFAQKLDEILIHDCKVSEEARNAGVKCSTCWDFIDRADTTVLHIANATVHAYDTLIGEDGAYLTFPYQFADRLVYLPLLFFMEMHRGLICDRIIAHSDIINCPLVNCRGIIPDYEQTCDVCGRHFPDMRSDSTNNITKPCPNCKRRYLKDDDGCDSVACLHCNTAFCWACLAICENCHEHLLTVHGPEMQAYGLEPSFFYTKVMRSHVGHPTSEWPIEVWEPRKTSS
ncbi:hypothetical protein GMRT_10868 [Giardia muris]|uniref:Uncharacterized protein n=1 Tax=Giardia muris TaxID=5742 RepID=A0A4Z1SRU2_GIAMU|nr:hypothetical protein GMRT_10868 [Giardia muris]|eukprot:TNJ28606.1 hypothetical protein GMRT_10868 [Giardia muris]